MCTRRDKYHVKHQWTTAMRALKDEPLWDEVRWWIRKEKGQRNQKFDGKEWNGFPYDNCRLCFSVNFHALARVQLSQGLYSHICRFKIRLKSKKGAINGIGHGQPGNGRRASATGSSYDIMREKEEDSAVPYRLGWIHGIVDLSLLPTITTTTTPQRGRQLRYK